MLSSTQNLENSIILDRLAKERLLFKLLTEAMSSKNSEELRYKVLNETSSLTPYDRALWWEKKQDQFLPYAKSGSFHLKGHSSAMERIGVLLQGLKYPEKTQVVTVNSCESNLQDLFKLVTKDPSHQQILWIPMIIKGEVVAGIWLERSTIPWKEEELLLLERLRAGYSAIFGRLTSQWNFKKIFLNYKGALAILFLSLASTVQIPNTYLATCQVIPSKKIAITAPMDGIIEKIDVTPGQMVEAQTPLVHYAVSSYQDLFREQLFQFKLAETTLKQFSLDFHKKNTPLPQLELLNLQSKTAKYLLNRTQNILKNEIIKAPFEGLCRFHLADKWEGKRVYAGEKILELCDMKSTKLMLHIPENFSGLFDAQREVKILLKNDSTLHYAQLTRMDSFPTQGFIEAEAIWVNPVDAPLGVQGQATLYGGEESLLQWALSYLHLPNYMRLN